MESCANVPTGRAVVHSVGALTTAAITLRDGLKGNARI
jgi:hypothetical protein